jgi:multidrug transporter EmrE-like cation transporter
MHPIVFALAVGSVSLNAMAQIALRKAMLTAGALPTSVDTAIGFVISMLLNLWFLAGMMCYVVSIGVWMVVLGKTEVSVAYPLISMGFIITAIIGYVYLGENVSLVRIAGIALICCGIVVVSRSA